MHNYSSLYQRDIVFPRLRIMVSLVMEKFGE